MLTMVFANKFVRLIQNIGPDLKRFSRNPVEPSSQTDFSYLNIMISKNCWESKGRTFLLLPQ